MSTLGASKYIGQRIKRREDPRFLTGRTSYVDDIRLPRMVHAAFVRSSYAHAEVVKFRTERACAHDGVVGVLTSDEVGKLARPLRGDLLLPGWRGTDRPILAWPRALFVGEAVAVVAGTSRYVAEDAADLVEVEYRALPVVADAARGLAPGAPILHEAVPGNVYIDVSANLGDVDGAFAQADLVWERTYSVHRHTGFPMEARGCIADYQPADRFLTFYSSTQIPHLVRTALADALGLQESHIRVIARDVGGGFGIKCALMPEDVAICVLAIRLGRPVKWIEDTREHLLSGGHAREQSHHVKVAVKRDGKILGIKADVVGDSGAYSSWPATAAMDIGMASNLIPGPYTVRNYQVRARAVCTNKCPIVPYRGVGRPAAAFTIERAIEDISRELNLDPVEVRRLNYVSDDAYPYTSVTGMVYDSASLVASLDKVVESVGYTQFRKEQARARDEGRYIGIGFGSFIEQTAHTTREMVKRGIPIVMGYDSVSLALDPSGNVVLDSSLHSHGQAHETVFAQVAAQRLGMRMEDIHVRFGDTRSAPYGMGTFASRSAVLGGGATWKASDLLRDALLRVAASVMEVSTADLDIEDSVVQVKGSPQSRMTVAEIARLIFHRPERLPSGMMPADFVVAQSYDADPGTGTWTNSIHAAIVEVDVATAAIRLQRYVVIEDCGVMINPLIVDGQVHGGTVQGIGGAMLEHLAYDGDGQLLSQTLAEYLLPTALDVPTIEVHHLSTPSGFTIGGFKGMGEGGAIAPLPAIANAVSDALAPFGVTVDTLPTSPERLSNLIEARRGGAGR